MIEEQEIESEYEDQIRLSKKKFKVSELGWDKTSAVHFEKTTSHDGPILEVRVVTGKEKYGSYAAIPWPIVESLIEWINHGAYVSPRCKNTTVEQLAEVLSRVKYGVSLTKSGFKRIEEAIEEHKLLTEANKDNQFPEAPKHPGDF